MLCVIFFSVLKRKRLRNVHFLRVCRRTRIVEKVGLIVSPRLYHARANATRCGGESSAVHACTCPRLLFVRFHGGRRRPSLAATHVRGCHRRRPRPGGPGGGEKTKGRKAKGRKEKGRGLAGKMKSTLFTHFQIEEFTGVSASHSNGSPPNSFTLKWSSPQFLHTEMALASTLKWFSYLYCENENRVDFA